MSYINDSLSQDEEVVEVFKHHWTAWVPMWFCIFPGVILLIPLVFAPYFWLALRGTEQGLTSKRAIRKTGIIGRSTEEMRLPKIETVEIEQGVLGRMLGYGNVKLTGMGISDLIFNNIDNPLDVKRTIESQLD